MYVLVPSQHNETKKYDQIANELAVTRLSLFYIQIRVSWSIPRYEAILV